jgi:hypothetical protein
MRDSTAPARYMKYRWIEDFAIAQERRGETQLERTVVSEEIGKDAIKGYLIYAQNCSTYATILQAQTSVYKMIANKNAPLKGNNAIYIYLAQ